MGSYYWEDDARHPGAVCSNYLLDQNLDMSHLSANLPIEDEQMVQLFRYCSPSCLGDFLPSSYDFYVPVSLTTQSELEMSFRRLIWQYRPISDQWDIFKIHKNCIDIQAFFIVSAAINSATDCLVYLWPIHYLINVNMPLRQRVGLIICFSTGIM
jgi:hypothetical protein